MKEEVTVGTYINYGLFMVIGPLIRLKAYDPNQLSHKNTRPDYTVFIEMRSVNSFIPLACACRRDRMSKNPNSRVVMPKMPAKVYNVFIVLY